MWVITNRNSPERHNAFFALVPLLTAVSFNTLWSTTFIHDGTRWSLPSAAEAFPQAPVNATCAINNNNTTRRRSAAPGKRWEWLTTAIVRLTLSYERSKSIIPVGTIDDGAATLAQSDSSTCSWRCSVSPRVFRGLAQ